MANTFYVAKSGGLLAKYQVFDSEFDPVEWESEVIGKDLSIDEANEKARIANVTADMDASEKTHRYAMPTNETPADSLPTLAEIHTLLDRAYKDLGFQLKIHNTLQVRLVEAESNLEKLTNHVILAHADDAKAFGANEEIRRAKTDKITEHETDALRNRKTQMMESTLALEGIRARIEYCNRALEIHRLRQGERFFGTFAKPQPE